LFTLLDIANSKDRGLRTLGVPHLQERQKRLERGFVFGVGAG